MTAHSLNAARTNTIYTMQTRESRGGWCNPGAHFSQFDAIPSTVGVFCFKSA
jgi:hypothetical protein